MSDRVRGENGGPSTGGLSGKMSQVRNDQGVFLQFLLLQERADGPRTAEGFRAEVNGKSES